MHHRGNSPSLADGYGAVLVASEKAAADIGLQVRARVRSWANYSVDPVIMLTAGQEAVRTAIARAGMTVDDVDRFEFAEAPAALCLKLERDLDLDPLTFNPTAEPSLWATPSVLRARSWWPHSSTRWSGLEMTGRDIVSRPCL